jgi:PleD family two-component response regulator
MVDGLQALREGRIPRLTISDRLDEYPRAFNPREFLLLANEGMRVARRYNRPFAVGRVTCTNSGALRRDHGVTVCDDALRRVVDVIVGALRESDFIALESANSILIGMPETSEKDALHTLERVSQQIRKSSTLPLELTACAADGQEVPEFLAREPVQ